jgi:uncharacterized membrane protein
MNKDVAVSLAWGAGIVVLALIASALRHQGIIDQESVQRLVIGATGLMIASFGNRAPKTVAPSVCAQHLSRFSGWSLVISGLVYAAVWAFAPIDTAIVIGTAAILIGILATFAYALRLRARSRQANG